MLLQAIFSLAGFSPLAAQAHRCILWAPLSLFPEFSLLPIPEPKASLGDLKQPIIKTSINSSHPFSNAGLVLAHGISALCM